MKSEGEWKKAYKNENEIQQKLERENYAQVLVIIFFNTYKIIYFFFRKLISCRFFKLFSATIMIKQKINIYK